MNFTESFRQALDSLKTNKLRSALTMTGIIMGVFSVITIMAIGNAARAYMDSQFEKLGANIISISYKTRDVNQNEWFTLEDVGRIKRVVPEIKNISVYIRKAGVLRIGSKTKDASVMGITSQYKSFSPLELSSGRFISNIDVSQRANIIVISESVARKYFRKENVIGETLQLRTAAGDVFKLRIAGVVKSEGEVFQSMFDSDTFPAQVMIPVTTMQAMYNIKKIDGIDISITAKKRLQEIGARIVKTLELTHGSKDKYMAQNSADIQKTLSNVMGVISAVLLVIAVITLIVGGIGIVNILLVSVSERIREIGVRKALGARRKDIVVQFIGESIIMTGLSGLAGIAIGIAAGGIISAKIKIPPVVDLKVIILAFLGSVALGLIFGVYPAKKAADLDPIEALRYE